MSEPPGQTPVQIREEWIKVSIARMELLAEDARHRLKLASELAIMGLRALVFINGGAIIALFTLVAPVSPSRLVQRADPHLLLWSFGIYAGGVAFGLTAIAIGYWSQQVIAVYEQETTNQTYAVMTNQEYVSPKHPGYANRLLEMAMACAILAIVCFIAGSAEALRAVI